MMEKTLYFAYGSNINLDQMRYRCPDAVVRGRAVLDGYELRFRGSGVATVEPKEGACVYGLLWELTEKCEAALDRYEGYPRLYVKQTLDVRTFDGQRIPVMAYVMNPKLYLKPSLPPKEYYLSIKKGYEQNGLPVGCLKYVFKDSLKECGVEPYSKELQTRHPQKVMSDNYEKPSCPLIGQDGNIFNLVGIAASTLREAGLRDQAKELTHRILGGECRSYGEALCLIGEYVEITDVHDHSRNKPGKEKNDYER